MTLQGVHFTNTGCAIQCSAMSPMLKLVKTGCDFWKLGVQNTPCTPGWLIHWVNMLFIVTTLLPRLPTCIHPSVDYFPGMHCFETKALIIFSKCWLFFKNPLLAWSTDLVINCLLWINLARARFDVITCCTKAAEGNPFGNRSLVGKFIIMLCTYSEYTYVMDLGIG